MFPVLLKFFALLLFLLPMSASAGYIDNQGRDWIRLGDTSGGNYTWHDIANVCDPASGACSGSVSIYRTSWQLLDLTGYQWALRAEVNDLFESFLGPVPLANGSYSVDFDSARELMKEIQPTYGDGRAGSLDDPYDPNTDPWWLIANGFTRDPLTRSYVSLSGGGQSPGTAWVNHSGDVGDYGDVSFGIWAYRPVPIPAAVWLFGSGLIGLIGLARRKKA